MKEHGGWVAPEILAIEQKVKGTKAQPDKVVFVGGSVGPYCQDLYRFRFQYGSRERFAEIAGFRSAGQARDCQKNYAARYKAAPDQWRKLEPLQKQVGKFFVVFADPVGSDEAIKKALLEAVEKAAPKKMSKLPSKAQPAGATVAPGELLREKAPPPLTRKKLGVRKYRPPPTGTAPTKPIQ